MLYCYLSFLARWRWHVLTFVVLVTGLLVAGALRLTFTTDYRVFFNQDDPYLVRLNEIHATYTKDDTVMFILTPRKGKVFDPKVLEAVE